MIEFPFFKRHSEKLGDILKPVDNVQDIVHKKNVHNIVQSHISLCLNNYSLD